MKKISPKDLTYLSDIYKWNFNAYKKADLFYKEISDDNIKKELIILSSMHKDICNKIEKLLK